MQTALSGMIFLLMFVPALAQAPASDQHASSNLHGWFGLQVKKVIVQYAEIFDLANTRGLMVNYIEHGSPAEKAGFQLEDIIIKFDDKPTEDSKSFDRMIALTQIGREINVKFLREGQKKEVIVVLVKRP